ncbi:helix-turn-helix transcriptional regulator [Flavobacterium ajazii]|uniref:helix-turn-helix transcriptional regulator n=1 Tax=Flavobacterium ajazii TaxID=2692318 RepID=UPI0013D19159|nr:helix-turn-helix transcriptional regulator [Flavobacterium ajazii]
MRTEGERLRYYIENKEVNLRQFCIENDILYTSLHPILTNSRALGMNILKKIMQVYPNLNINWVLTGAGEMDIENNDSLREPNSVYQNSDPGYEAFLKYFEKETTTDKILAIIEKKLEEKKE